MKTTTVTVHPTQEDYAVAGQYVAKACRLQGNSFWPIRLVALAAFLLFTLGIAGLYSYRPPTSAVGPNLVRISAHMLLASVALVCVAIFLHRRSLALVLFGPGSNLLMPYTFTISEVGIFIDSASGTRHAPWSAIRSVVVVGEQLLFFTQPNAALMLPAHAFQDRTEFQALAEALTALPHAA